MNDATRQASMFPDSQDAPFAQLWQQPYTLWVQGFARLQSEALRFAAERAAKDLRLPLDLARSENPVRAFGVAASFAVEAARDYAAASSAWVSLAAGDFESAAAAVI